MPGRSQQDILYEILLKAGLPLTAQVETVGLAERGAEAPNPNSGESDKTPTVPSSSGSPELGRGGQEYYSVADGALLVCLADPILPETLDAMRLRGPKRVICLDMAFHGNDQLKTNAVLQMKAGGIEFRTV